MREGGHDRGYNVIPMRRRAFTILAAVSLLLCVATAALWVRSYWVVDKCREPAPGCALWLMSGFGRVGFALDIGANVNNRSFVVHQHPRPGDYRGHLGFRSQRLMSRDQEYTVLMPDWLLTGLFAVLPFLRTRRRSLHPDRCNGVFCAACGYDLRATPDRCPECGAMPQAKATV